MYKTQCNNHLDSEIHFAHHRDATNEEKNGKPQDFIIRDGHTLVKHANVV